MNPEEYDLDMELTEDKKKQLIDRVTECANGGILRSGDWFAIYDILLEATHREHMRAVEEYVIEQVNGGDSE